MTQGGQLNETKALLELREPVKLYPPLRLKEQLKNAQKFIKAQILSMSSQILDQIANTKPLMNWNWITPPGGNGQSFYTYCMDVLNYLTDPQTVNVLSTESVPDTSAVADRGAKAAWLFNQYSSGIRSESNEGVADTQAAALQVAIWEVLYDATPNLASGYFRV